MRLDKLAWRCVLIGACVPLVLLTGCPQQKSATVPAQATAPSVAQQAGTPDRADGAAPAQSNSTPTSSASSQQLIARVEKSYSRGVDDYKAGRLDAARADFDLAVDTMLTSGLDLKGDPQLADEFERLLNQVNALEMDALKQGNGLSPAIEAAPLDDAAEVTFAANPELTAQLNKELVKTSDLPLVINDQVAGYIGLFANSPSFHAHMLRSMERAGKYKTMIQKILADQGVPQDLIYLAVAESGFQPQALNPKSGAGGMWQFMPTGAYGLARNGLLDERFDPEKSSLAYAKYMKFLYNQMGDWYLAMAAYDWGAGNVQRAVMHTGYADFWELYRRNALPSETRDYVPKILAAIIMAKNPQRYGLDRMVPEAAVISDTVTVDYGIDLRLVADVTDASLQEIVALNPSLLRLRTPGDMDFDLHIPVGTKDVYLDRLKAIPEEKRIAWRFHTVRPGESLESIAGSLHAHVAEIAEANGIGATEPVAPGDELVVPLATAAGGMGRTQHYTLRRGETLVMVADRFNVSTEDLRKWNHLSSSAVKPGRSLAVSAPVMLAPSMHARGRAARGKHNAAASTRARMNTGAAKGAAHRGKSSSKAVASSHAGMHTAKAATKSSHGKHKAAR